MPTDAAVDHTRLIRRSVVAAFVLYVTFGVPDGVLGTVWPNLRDDFGRSDGAFGVVALCISAGYAGGGAASGNLTKRISLGSKIAIAMTLAVLAIGAIASAPTWWVAMVGFAVLGLGWGYADAALNAWMALTQGPREMGMLHASYGVGAFAGPLLATVLVADGTGWRAPYVACALLTGGAVALLATTRAGYSIALERPADIDTDPPAAGGNRLAALMILWFSVYVGAEVAVGSWSFTLMTEGRGLSDVAAGLWTASYWGGLMVGRFGLAVVGHRLVPETTMRAAGAVAVAAGVWLWADPGGVGTLGLPLFGLAFSVMFPLLMGRTPRYLGDERAERSVGYQIAASALGFTTLPALIGVVADDHGIEWAAPFFLVTTLVCVGIWLLIEREAPDAAVTPRSVG